MEYREPNQVKWVGVRPAHNGEQVHKTSILSSTTLTELYSVPSDKTLFISTAAIMPANSTNHASKLMIYDSEDNFINYIACATFLTSQAASPAILTFNPPLEVLSSYSIKMQLDAAVSTVFLIHGWVE